MIVVSGLATDLGPAAADVAAVATDATFGAAPAPMPTAPGAAAGDGPFAATVPVAAGAAPLPLAAAKTAGFGTAAVGADGTAVGSTLPVAVSVAAAAPFSGAVVAGPTFASGAAVAVTAPATGPGCFAAPALVPAGAEAEAAAVGAGVLTTGWGWGRGRGGRTIPKTPMATSRSRTARSRGATFDASWDGGLEIGRGLVLLLVPALVPVFPADGTVAGAGCSPRADGTVLVPVPEPATAAAAAAAAEVGADGT